MTTYDERATYATDEAYTHIINDQSEFYNKLVVSWARHQRKYSIQNSVKLYIRDNLVDMTATEKRCIRIKTLMSELIDSLNDDMKYMTMCIAWDIDTPKKKRVIWVGDNPLKWHLQTSNFSMEGHNKYSREHRLYVPVLDEKWQYLRR